MGLRLGVDFRKKCPHSWLETALSCCKVHCWINASIHLARHLQMRKFVNIYMIWTVPLLRDIITTAARRHLSLKCKYKSFLGDWLYNLSCCFSWGQSWEMGFLNSGWKLALTAQFPDLNKCLNRNSESDEDTLGSRKANTAWRIP